MSNMFRYLTFYDKIQSYNAFLTHLWPYYVNVTFSKFAKSSACQRFTINEQPQRKVQKKKITNVILHIIGLNKLSLAMIGSKKALS